MSHNPTARLRPVEETVRDKYDVLEWSNIPGTPCDLNYRPPFATTWRKQITPLLLLGLAGGAAIPVACFVGTGIAPWIASWPWAAGAILLGLIMAAVSQLGSGASDDFPVLSGRALLFLAAPTFLWAAMVLTAGVTNPARALLYLAVAIPVAVWVADRVATHAVYWMTANLAVDSTVLRNWREDWGRRFTSEPHLLAPTEELQTDEAKAVAAAVVEARAGYAPGICWLGAAFIVPTLFVVLTVTPASWPTVGLQIVYGGFCGLLLAAAVRCRGEIQTLRRVWWLFLHWFHFGRSRRTPPWMFQSPCGGYLRRRCLSVLAVATISVVLTYLTAHSVASFAFPAGHDGTLVPGVESLLGPGRIPPVSRMSEVLSAFWAVYQPFLFVSLLSFTVPVLVHLLMIVVLIGPVVHTYYEALEG